jgi:hypothetical protein
MLEEEDPDPEEEFHQNLKPFFVALKVLEKLLLLRNTIAFWSHFDNTLI